MSFGGLKCMISPTRTYVAMVLKNNFDGFRFVKFVLPNEYENTDERAAWYFLNKLDFVSCIQGVFPFEDYSDLKEE